MSGGEGAGKSPVTEEEQGRSYGTAARGRGPVVQRAAAAVSADALPAKVASAWPGLARPGRLIARPVGPL